MVATTAVRPVTDGADHGGAVAALFESQYAPLCRLALLMLGERGAAEEVVMDAFERTLAAWGRIRDHDRAEAYVRRAVVNRCISRSRRRRNEWRSNEAVAAGAGDAPAGDVDVEERATSLAVLNATLALPPRQRATVVLRYYEDRPEAEIARLLGCAPGTVKSQLAKARATLSRTLASTEQEGRR